MSKKLIIPVVVTVDFAPEIVDTKITVAVDGSLLWTEHAVFLPNEWRELISEVVSRHAENVSAIADFIGKGEVDSQD
jgi:hypothetical protein